MDMSNETTLWQGRPSQWLNLLPFSITVIIAIGIGVGGVFFSPAWAFQIVPLLYILWRWLFVRATRFELTSERLRVTEGILNQKIDEIELYRVKDIAMERPLWMRMTGLASVLLDTSDRSMPKLTLPAISNGVELREQLRKQVEEIRDKKRVREVDMEEPHNHDGMTGDHSA